MIIETHNLITSTDMKAEIQKAKEGLEETARKAKCQYFWILLSVELTLLYFVVLLGILMMFMSEKDKVTAFPLTCIFLAIAVALSIFRKLLDGKEKEKVKEAIRAVNKAETVNYDRLTPEDLEPLLYDVAEELTKHEFPETEIISGHICAIIDVLSLAKMGNKECSIYVADEECSIYTGAELAHTFILPTVIVDDKGTGEFDKIVAKATIDEGLIIELSRV